MNKPIFLGFLETSETSFFLSCFVFINLSYHKKAIGIKKKMVVRTIVVYIFKILKCYN